MAGALAWATLQQVAKMAKVDREDREDREAGEDGEVGEAVEDAAPGLESGRTESRSARG
jgi:hypothetical protein